MLAVYDAGSALSSATKGAERELFVELVLRNVLPPHVRLGPGDIVDAAKRTSGQVDIVLESTMSLSFPSTVVSGPRLYLAEGVVAVIEVKSDLRNQWRSVVRKVHSLQELRRRTSVDGPNAILEVLEATRRLMLAQNNGKNIQLDRDIERFRQEVATRPVYRGDLPVYVVGFRGWTQAETLVRRADELNADGVLTLDPPIGHFRNGLVRKSGSRRDTTTTRTCSGPDALLYLLHAIAESWRKDVGEVAQDLRPYLQNRTILDHHVHLSEPSATE